MDKVGALMLRHPAGTMIVLSLLMAYSVSRVYKIGLLTGTMREHLAEEARMASEALGG